MDNAISKIFDCKRKTELEKLCKNIKIPKRDFADFIIGSEAGLTRLNHIMQYLDYYDPKVEERKKYWNSIELNTEPNSKEHMNAFNRLIKIYELRQYRVGHMFFSKEREHPIKEWHFIFFEIKELHGQDNHWINGQHIHFTNYLWPNLYCQNIWDDFIERKIFPKQKLHISFIDESRNI